MNFIESYKKGQEGGNKGIPLSGGLSKISEAINGVQRARIYGLASAPKVGKSTLADVMFVIEVFLYCLEHNIELDIQYYSYEIARVNKEFDLSVHFLNRDHGITHIKLEEGQTKEGKSEIEISSDYLMGRLIDDQGNQIKVKESVEKVLKIVYEERIVPLFGEFDAEGNQISQGVITFHQNRNNPTGIWKELLNHASENGKFNYKRWKKDGVEHKRIVGYTPNNPEKFTIVILDHLRKVIPERGFTLKQTVDKTIEYQVELRNWCGYTFLDIIHLNRSMTDMNRIKFAGDLLYPNSDDIKDSGNLAEEADYMFTMFNPNDERYNLSKHFGKTIKDNQGNELYPNMRTIHLVENRHGFYPQHFVTNMLGNIKKFDKLEIK